MAEHLDGSTPLHVRAAILRRVDQGHTRVLCNVGVAIEGLDIPRLKCCVLARPTKSLARYLQMGRARSAGPGRASRRAFTTTRF
jgi:superfamily II DNA or RNA helicase